MTQSQDRRTSRATPYAGCPGTFGAVVLRYVRSPNSPDQHKQPMWSRRSLGASWRWRTRSSPRCCAAIRPKKPRPRRGDERAGAGRRRGGHAGEHQRAACAPDRRRDLRGGVGADEEGAARRARQGVSLEAFLHACRLWGQVFWQTIREVSDDNDPDHRDAALTIAGRVMAHATRSPSPRPARTSTARAATGAPARSCAAT